MASVGVCVASVIADQRDQSPKRWVATPAPDSSVSKDKGHNNASYNCGARSTRLKVRDQNLKKQKPVMQTDSR